MHRTNGQTDRQTDGRTGCLREDGIITQHDDKNVNNEEKYNVYLTLACAEAFSTVCFGGAVARIRPSSSFKEWAECR